MKRIAIDCSFENGQRKYYGIVFNGSTIEKFLIVPLDYSLDEFVKIVNSEIDGNAQAVEKDLVLNSMICLNVHNP